jgi:hypothetical protein
MIPNTVLGHPIPLTLFSLLKDRGVKEKRFIPRQFNVVPRGELRSAKPRCWISYI